MWPRLYKLVSARHTTFTVPSAASALAKHGADVRKASWRALRDEKLAAFRADIAAGRISQLGWKQ